MEVALGLVSVLSHGVFHFNVQFLGRNFLFETFFVCVWKIHKLLF